MNTNTTTTSTNGRRSRGAGIALVGCVCLAATLAACAEEDGSGDIATLTLSNPGAEDVTSLTVFGDIDVRVNVDPNATQQATLRVDDNLINNVEAWIDDDGELYVGWADYLVDVEPSEQPVLTIDVQRFHAVENLSDATVTVSGVDEADLDIENDGDGSVEVVA
jgi:hypothetical protein